VFGLATLPLRISLILPKPPCFARASDFLHFEKVSLLFFVLLAASMQPGRRELELGLILTQMAQKPVLLAEIYARAWRARQNAKRAEVWVGLRCA
jgi:hypothetical protein